MECCCLENSEMRITIYLAASLLGRCFVFTRIVDKSDASSYAAQEMSFLHFDSLSYNLVTQTEKQDLYLFSWICITCTVDVGTE